MGPDPIDRKNEDVRSRATGSLEDAPTEEGAPDRGSLTWEGHGGWQPRSSALRERDGREDHLHGPQRNAVDGNAAPRGW